MEEDWEYLPADADADADALALTIPVRSLPSLFDMDYFSTTDSPPKFNFPPSPTLHQHPRPEQGDDAVYTPDAAASNNVFFKNISAKESIESVDIKFQDSSSSPTATSPTKNVFDDLFCEDAISKSLTLIKSGDDIKHQSDHDVIWIGEGIVGDGYAIEEDDDDPGISNGLNLWKLGLGGIGAICSFGVAAATICLILFGNNHKAKQSFQLYSAANDQRMNQVVQQATKFNEAMSAAVRGVPLNRAHFTYGGYYDNSL